MYDPGPGNYLSFLPRAMEWHLTLAALSILGAFFPWAFALVGLGLAYTVGYCVSCACQAKLDVLTATEGSPTFARTLKWRAMIALLHFIEPLARDWGRLKGGLTPWRSVSPSVRMRDTATPWWQRLEPFKHEVRWSIPGTAAVDRYPFLHRLLNKLNSKGYAAGWNPTSHEWDLKVRRGALAFAWLRMVVEHHGGPKRLARLSAVIRPAGVLYWVYGVTLALSLVMGLRGRIGPAAVLAVGFAVLWIAATAEASRLEAATMSTSAEVADELESERNLVSVTAVPKATASEVQGQTRRRSASASR
jgi:O-antigen biosynthesis protein